LHETFINNLSKFEAEFEGDEKKKAEQTVNLLYSFASNKPLKNFRIHEPLAKILQEVVDHFEYVLEDVPRELDLDHTVRLVTALNLLGRKGNGVTLKRCDENLLRNLDKAEPYHISSILRNFSRMYKGYSWG